MAEERTIISFELELGDSAQQAEKLTVEMEQLRKTIKNTRTENKKLSKTNEQLSKELQKEGTNRKELQKEIVKNTETIKKNSIETAKNKDKLTDINRERKKAVDITKIQAHTLEGLRKQTKALFAEREKLNTSTKKGSKRFAELTKKIKSNNDQIKKADQAAGSYTSSIGNYSEAIAGATGEFGMHIQSVINAAKGMQKVAIAQSRITSGFGKIKKALVASGIGALVVILGTIFLALTKTQKGMDGVSKFLAQMGAVLDVVFGRLIKFADALWELINLNFGAAWNLATEAISDFGDEVGNAWKQAGKLEEALQRLEIQEANTNKRLSERRKTIQELIFLTRDETASYEERQAALVKANELEIANMNDAIALQKIKVQLIEDEIAATPEVIRDREQLIRLTEAETALIDLTTGSLARQRELRNRVTELTNKQLAAEKKLHEDRKKAIEDEIEDELELERFNKEVDDKLMQEADEKIQKAFDKEREMAEEAAAEKIRLAEEVATKEIQLREEVTMATRQGISLTAQALNVSLKNEEQRINSSYNRQLKSLEKRFKSGLISQEVYEKKRIELDHRREIELYKIEKERFRINKIAALAQVAINIAEAVAKVWAQTGLGGIIAQVLPIAAGITQAGIISAQDPPSPPVFEQGGAVKSFVVGGNYHNAGGTTYTGDDGNKIILEKGEGLFATKRQATAEALSSINQKHGGRSFFNAPGKYLASGGGVKGIGADAEMIQQTVKQVLKNVVIITKVEDIQTGLVEYQGILNEGIVE